MVVLGLSCHMAYHLHGVSVPHQQPLISKPLKDVLPVLRPAMRGLCSQNMHFNRLDESWRSLDGVLENHDTMLKVDSLLTRPVIIDLGGSLPDSFLIGHGISEKLSRNEEILRNLASPFCETQGSELDLSFSSPGVGLQSPDCDWHPQAFSHYDLGISYDEEETMSSLIIPSCDLHTTKHGLDYMGHLSRNLKTVIGLDNQVLFKGIQSEVTDIQSVIAHYNLAGKRKTYLGRKQSVVPYYFRRTKVTSKNKAIASSTTKVKSPEKVMNTPSSRRSSTKFPVQRCPYANTYSHACEILLSLIMNKGHHDKTMLLSLKRSGPELPELLTKFSVLIAGTGVSVILIVVAKMACGRLPISSSKVLSTCMGFGLLWLSMGVNKLRDTIINISRSSSKLKFVDESPMSKVDESMNTIFLRAAILMVLVFLKLS